MSQLNKQELLQQSVDVVISALKRRVKDIGSYIDSVRGQDEAAIKEANNLQDLCYGLELEFGALMGWDKDKKTDTNF